MIICSISKVGRKGHKKNIVICSTRKGKMNMDIFSISIAKVGNKKNTKFVVSVLQSGWKFVVSVLQSVDGNLYLDTIRECVSRKMLISKIVPS